MPPHCDSIDGPVVSAARDALTAGEVGLVLPFVPEEAEAEVQARFGRVLPVHGLGPEAADVADRLFFETVVRLHRAGEGAPYTGLKPAGLPHGPALPLAEQAVAAGSPDALADFRSLSDARRYVQAMLGFEVYSHHLLEAMQTERR